MTMLSILSQVPTVPATGENAVDFTWLFLRMMLVLGIVIIAAILILKFVVPKIGLAKHFQHGKIFSVIGRYVLEPKRSLYLVNVGKRYLVIGVSENAINLVTEISEEDATGEKRT